MAQVIQKRRAQWQMFATRVKAEMAAHEAELEALVEPTLPMLAIEDGSHWDSDLAETDNELASEHELVSSMRRHARGCLTGLQ